MVVVDALLGLLFDHFEHEVEAEIFRTPDARDGFVDRHGADGYWRGVDDGFANFRNVATSGKIHDRVGAVVHRVVQLLQFLVDVGAGRGVTDVRIDLALGGDPNGHRLQIAVMDVGGDDAAAARDFVADQLRLELFAPGDKSHLFGDGATPREVHLRHIAPVRRSGVEPFGRRRGIAVAVSGGLLRLAFFDPTITQCHGIPQRAWTCAGKREVPPQ